MSEAPQGSGWWQASDLKWYPPERTPGYTAQQPQPAMSARPTQQPPVTTRPRSVLVRIILGGLVLLALAVAILVPRSLATVRTVGSGAMFSTVSARPASAYAIALGVVVVIVIVGVAIARRARQPRTVIAEFVIAALFLPLAQVAVAESHHGESGSFAGVGVSDSGPNKIIVNNQALDMGAGKPRVSCYGMRGSQTLDLASAGGQPRVEIDMSNDDILSPDSPMDVKSVTIVASGHTLTAPLGDKANGEESTTAKFVQDDRNWKVTGWVTGESLDHRETFEVDVTCP
jgi:hypothetical protein